MTVYFDIERQWIKGISKKSALNEYAHCLQELITDDVAICDLTLIGNLHKQLVTVEVNNFCQHGSSYPAFKCDMNVQYLIDAIKASKFNDGVYSGKVQLAKFGKEIRLELIY